jgi:hypothetical protein
MPTYTNRAGHDIDLAVTPDTPRAWDRYARLVAAVDHLTAGLPDGDWSIRIDLPDHTTITAAPATTRESAA